MFRIVLVLLCILAQPAAAQLASRELRTPPAFESVNLSTQTSSLHRDIATAAGTGLLGWLGGAALGAVAGYQLGGDCGGCDDPGLEEAIIEGTIGGAIGAGLTAAWPRLHDRCTYDARMARAFLGSALGAALGITLHETSGLTIVIPVLSIGAAAGGAVTCGGSAPARPA